MLRLVDEDGDVLIEFDEDDVRNMSQYYMTGWSAYLCDAVEGWYQDKAGRPLA